MPDEKGNYSQMLTGAPEEIRTPDPQIRSLVLYPAELRALNSAAGRPAHGTGHSYRLDPALARVAAIDGASGAARVAARVAPLTLKSVALPG